jgi:hypothetical protein
MFANEEMGHCYGYAPGKLCRMCQFWAKEYCQKTNRRQKCPAWGQACGKFQSYELSKLYECEV